MVDKARYVTIAGSVGYARTERTNPIETSGAAPTHPAGRGALKGIANGPDDFGQNEPNAKMSSRFKERHSRQWRRIARQNAQCAFWPSIRPTGPNTNFYGTNPTMDSTMISNASRRAT